ncbi:MAG: hypothetical protein E6J79_10680 [Deltaproteobacteria bacterium]|nr:MAG: hypothetical protein E6J79_10680 [Deltaproteobacteria bacterium]
MWRGPIAAVVFFTGLAVTIARGADGDAERVVRYADDQLTVRLARAPVGEVLGEIGRQSGAEIRGEPNPREVTAEFENVPLLDALHRLLGNQNFMLKYGEKSRLVAIDLLAGEGAPPGTTSVAARVSSTTTVPQPPQQTLQEALQRFPAVPITGALAGALGTNTATIDQLVNTALHHDDAGVRAEALRTTLNAVESDATLRGSLLATVNCGAHRLAPWHRRGPGRGARGARRHPGPRERAAGEGILRAAADPGAGGGRAPGRLSDPRGQRRTRRRCATAALWAASVELKVCVPSPRATK